jgi:septal ring factor EnvC (AmiA/AmiB activator)
MAGLGALVALHNVALGEEREAATANPIRKVVTMLQMLEKKVQEEGLKEEAMFKKFMCYCQNSGGDLQKSIDSSTAKVPELQSSIEESEAQEVQLKEDLTKHRADREAAKKVMAEATAIREKESAAFVAFKAEADANIAAINSAVTALVKGMSGTFLQTNGADALKKLVQSKEDMVDGDRQTVLAFLSGTQSADSEYAPSSGEITGILKGLGDEMSQALADATNTEDTAKKNFDGLMAAKTKEVSACTAAIEDKTVRVGEMAVSIANMKNDLTDTEAALIEDQKFLAGLETSCKTKQAEWDEIVKARANELVALSDTIKLLNDDDALELFKKALPSASASLMQVSMKDARARGKALALIRSAQQKSNIAHPQLDFIALALHGKKIGFDKVLKMIDEMTALLKSEQVDDDNKKEYCDVQFDHLDDKRKSLERTVSDAEKSIDEATDAVATLGSEIKALAAGIVALDKSVAQATEQRKAENEDFTQLMAQNNAAKELIGMAKNRLNKLYNPKLYVPPPKRELSEQDRIAVNLGGTAPPTPAPGGIGGTGITYLAQVQSHNAAQTVTAPRPPPEAPGPFKKKGEESNGVIAMMDILIADLDKENTVAKTEEQDAQADYETMLTDSSSKRAADSKALAQKGADKADTEAALQQHTDNHDSSSKELMATKQVIGALHNECDWLIQYYDMRKEARTGEIDSLAKAKAVLSGADFSLLQTRGQSRGQPEPMPEPEPL